MNPDMNKEYLFRSQKRKNANSTDVFLFLFVGLLVTVSSSWAAGAIYYMDNSATGANNGSVGNNAWQSINDCLNSGSLVAGDIVEIYTGDGSYGNFTFGQNHTAGTPDNYITFQAAIGNKPRFEWCTISAYPSRNIYLKFKGLEFGISNPGLDPTNPPWNNTHPVPWNRLRPILDLDNVNYLEFEDCKIHGFDRYSIRYFVEAIRCNNITLKKNEFYHALGDIFFRASNHITYEGNYIHSYGGSSIFRVAHTSYSSTELQTDFNIINNHVYDGRNNPEDDFYPLDVLVDSGGTVNGTFQVGEGINSSNGHTGQIVKTAVVNGTRVIWNRPTGTTSSEQNWAMITGGVSGATMICRTKAAADTWIAANMSGASNGLHAGSVVSISTHVENVTIRGNIFHTHPGQGIMFYAKYPPYKGIIFENNLLYDIGNGNRFSKMSPSQSQPVVIRNNTFIGYVLTDTVNTVTGILTRYAYAGQTKSTVSMNLATGSDPQYLTFCNNIVLAPYDLPNYATTNFQEGHNIYYRGPVNGTHVQFPASNTSLTCVWSNDRLHGYPNYFENLSQKQGFNQWTQEQPSEGYTYQPFFVDPKLYTQWISPAQRPRSDILGSDCGKFANYHLAEGSLGINFGDPTNQPGDSLGSIGPDGFIRDDGPLRNATRHSIGAYEYSTIVSDSTEPSVPANLTAQAVSENQIDLSWQASADLESGVSYYNIYRGNTQIDTITSTTYSDTGLSGGTPYSYQVSAVNGAGLESARSNAAQATTPSDNTPPTILDVTAHSPVHVLFSEPLDQTSAEITANYSISPPVTIISATLQEDLRTIILETSDHQGGIDYTLTVNGVMDVAGNPTSEETGIYRYNDGLVGFWEFEEGSDLTTADSSVNGNTGTLANDQMWTGFGELDFDGSDDYVNCGAGSSLNLTNSLTISAWISPRSFGQAGWGRIVDKGNGASGFSFFLNESDYGLGYVIYGGPLAWSNSAVVTLNQQQHVAVVYDESLSTITFYVDGQPAGSSNYQTNPIDSSSNPLYIGIRGFDMNRDFDGLIGNVRIYNRALSSTEIQQLSSANNSGLIGLWRFNDEPGNTAQDASGYDNTATLVNGPVWTEHGSVWTKQGVLNFDGIDDAVEIPTNYWNINLHCGLMQRIWPARTTSSAIPQAPAAIEFSFTPLTKI